MGICESCGLLVKIEALESHVRLRHGLPLGAQGIDPLSSAVSMSSRSSSQSTSCFNSLLKHHHVDLSKITAKLKHGIRLKNSSRFSLRFLGPFLKLLSDKNFFDCSSHTPCPPTSRSKSPSPDKEPLPSPDPKVKDETGSFSVRCSPGVDVDSTNE